MNDTTSINDTIWITVGNYEEINKQRHKLMYQLNNRPVTSYSKTNSITEWKTEHTTDQITAAKKSLPEEIQLFSFMLDDLTVNNNTIFRFHHVYDDYDRSPFDISVNFILDQFFRFQNVSFLKEMSLSLLYDLPNSNPNNVTLTTLSFKTFSSQPVSVF